MLKWRGRSSQLRLRLKQLCTKEALTYQGAYSSVVYNITLRTIAPILDIHQLSMLYYQLDTTQYEV